MATVALRTSTTKQKKPTKKHEITSHCTTNLQNRVCVSLSRQFSQHRQKKPKKNEITSHGYSCTTNLPNRVCVSLSRQFLQHREKEEKKTRNYIPEEPRSHAVVASILSVVTPPGQSIRRDETGTAAADNVFAVGFVCGFIYLCV
jgi:hypothetical protein